jgi:hypothetical protein
MPGNASNYYSNNANNNGGVVSPLVGAGGRSQTPNG